MEFENSSRDPRTDYLRYALPELIRMKYVDYEKVDIEYTPRVTSVLDNTLSKLKDGILLYGNFNTINSNIVVSFNVYDVNTWEEKSNRSFRCELNDIECIENAFYVCVEEDVMSFYCDYFDCLGECGGTAIEDECGICNGSGPVDGCGCDDIPEGHCDCDNNVLDEFSQIDNLDIDDISPGRKRLLLSVETQNIDWDLNQDYENIISFDC